MSQRTAGDLMFEAYLGEHDYLAPQHEPDLGATKRPDYVIERQGNRCVVEVKEFAANTRSFPDQRFGTTSAEVVLKPIRSQIREAARQLKSVAELGLPLVVMLTNPHGALVMLGVQEMVSAMYGDPVVVMDIDPQIGAAITEPRQELGRNGRLARDHQYISAVAILGHRERSADWYDEMNERHADLPGGDRWQLICEAEARGERLEGSYYRVSVFKTLSPSAIQLPDTFFAGEHDRVFAPNDEGTAYIQVPR